MDLISQSEELKCHARVYDDMGHLMWKLDFNPEISKFKYNLLFTIVSEEIQKHIETYINTYYKKYKEYYSRFNKLKGDIKMSSHHIITDVYSIDLNIKWDL